MCCGNNTHICDNFGSYGVRHYTGVCGPGVIMDEQTARLRLHPAADGAARCCSTLRLETVAQLCGSGLLLDPAARPHCSTHSSLSLQHTHPHNSTPSSTARSMHLVVARWQRA